MTEEEIRAMFGPGIPMEKFVVHDWRNEVVQKGVAVFAVGSIEDQVEATLVDSFRKRP